MYKSNKHLVARGVIIKPCVVSLIDCGLPGDVYGSGWAAVWIVASAAAAAGWRTAAGSFPSERWADPRHTPTRLHTQPWDWRPTTA